MQPKEGVDQSSFGLQAPRLNRSAAYAIEAELESKGFVRTTDGDPDFRVNFLLSIDPVTEITQLNRFYG